MTCAVIGLLMVACIAIYISSRI